MSYTLIEQQLRNRGILSTYARSAEARSAEADPLAHAQFARAVPVLCVNAVDILAGVPAAEAAMPNIQITPLNWWSERKCQVRRPSGASRAVLTGRCAGGDEREAQICAAARRAVDEHTNAAADAGRAGAAGRATAGEAATATHDAPEQEHRV